ncbi:MAG: LysE family translocator [Bacteroidales bacterium]
MLVLRICLEGIVLGLGLAIMLGPAFFALLQTSIERGFPSAVRLALGVITSDFLLVSISFFGAASLFSTPNAKDIVGVIGGLILVGIGIYTFRKKVNFMEELDPAAVIQLPSQWTYYIKGFFMNMANPATWLFWFFWVGVISSQYTTDTGLHHWAVVLFFSMSLLTIFLTDVGKAYIAHQLKVYVQQHTIKVINRVVGVILGAFGVYLFARSIYPLVLQIYTLLTK